MKILKQKIAFLPSISLSCDILNSPSVCSMGKHIQSGRRKGRSRAVYASMAAGFHAEKRWEGYWRYLWELELVRVGGWGALEDTVALMMNVNVERMHAFF
jgi:hypothetical protein